MAAQAKVIIKGQNDIGGAVKAAASDLGSLKGAADKLGGVLKTAFSGAAIIASVKMLGDAVAGCFPSSRKPNGPTSSWPSHWETAHRTRRSSP